MSLRPDSLRDRLRNATGGMHDELEQRLDLFNAFADRELYRALLCRMYGLYVPLEDALRRIDWGASGIDFSTRSRVGYLKADLKDLEVGEEVIRRLPLCAAIPAINTPADGIGVLYVLEGSTLGGQLILRRIGESLGFNPQHGGRFFNSHGRDVGRMWREFLEVLETYREPKETADAVERAGVGTFMTFNDWFDCMRGQRVTANPRLPS